jgi:TPR repeat protein
VKQDYAEAVRWYRKAAEQGHAEAQCNLGSMYHQGKGVKQDFAEAVRWFRKAAEQEHARAQFNCGAAYANGEGVNQDYAEALRWMHKAAEQGLADAKAGIKTIEDAMRASSSAKPAASPRPSCANCGAMKTADGSPLKPCTRCKAVVYCGVPCQTQHWKKGGHRAVCKGK